MTSIEWLIEQLSIDQYPNDIPKILEKAKEIHKQEIINSFESGQQNTALGFYIKDGEKYYNKINSSNENSAN